MVAPGDIGHDAALRWRSRRRGWRTSTTSSPGRLDRSRRELGLYGAAAKLPFRKRLPHPFQPFVGANFESAARWLAWRPTRWSWRMRLPSPNRSADLMTAVSLDPSERWTNCGW